MRHLLLVGIFVTAVVLGVAGAGATARAGATSPDVCQRRRADPLRQLHFVSPARRGRANGAAHLRRGAAVGAIDQGEGREAADAAVVCRSRARHVRQRRAAEPGADRHDREMGGCRRAARQSGRRAQAAGAHRRLAAGRARFHHHSAGDRDSRGGQGHLPDTESHHRHSRGSLDSRARDSSEQPRSHAPLGAVHGRRYRRRHGRAVRICRPARSVGRRHAADGVSRGRRPVDPQGTAAPHQPALSPERQAPDRSDTGWPLLRQGRAEEGSGDRRRGRRQLQDSRRREEPRDARALRDRPGHQRRVVPSRTCTCAART